MQERMPEKDLKSEYIEKGKAMCVDTAACRQNAQGALRDRMERQATKTQALEILIRVIPWNLLSSRDEETLWRYFSERN